VSADELWHGTFKIDRKAVDSSQALSRARRAEKRAAERFL